MKGNTQHIPVTGVNTTWYSHQSARRKVIYKTLREDVIEIIKKLCKEMKVEIIEGEACPDHIHLLVSIPPYMSIAQFVGDAQEQKAP